MIVVFYQDMNTRVIRAYFDNIIDIGLYLHLLYHQYGSLCVCVCVIYSIIALLNYKRYTCVLKGDMGLFLVCGGSEKSHCVGG